MRPFLLILKAVFWLFLLGVCTGAAEAKDPFFKLPPVDMPPGPEAPLSFAPQVLVSKFKFVGNTVFSDQELSELTRPYENRRITSEELQEVRHTLTRYYVDRKYINSGVIIPDQQVENGVITLLVVEGRLEKIEVSGNKRLRAEYIRDRISLGAGPPLNTDVLQERLQLLQQNPLISRINAEIRPGITPGQDGLRVRIEEEKPYQLEARFKNDRPPSVGELGFEVHASHGNLTGWGDRLGIMVGVTEGMEEISGYYSIPLNRWDATLELMVKKNDASVIEEPFNEIDITSELETFGIALKHPLLKKPGRLFSLSLSAERRHSETFLLGMPFSFSPGVQNGESDVTVIRFAQEALKRSVNQVCAVRSVFNWGIHALGATENDDAPDSRFFSWLGQFQWARRLTILRETELIFRTDLQLAADPLLPMERFAVGGVESVRGYRENQLVRDNGLVSSLELRIPLLRLPIPKISRTIEEGMLRLALFADIGRAWNTKLPTPDLTTLFSVGPGLRWDPSSNIHAHVYWGIPLRDAENNGSTLQDSGIHFELRWRFL